jgi:capsid assembly protease
MNAERFRIAARAFLATARSEIVAWEPQSLDRLLTALEGVCARPATAKRVDLPRSSLGHIGAVDSGSWEYMNQPMSAALGGRLAVDEAHRPVEASQRSIAVVPLVGVLTPRESFLSLFGLGTGLDGFTRRLTTAATDPAITAIFVPIDSPGGFVTGAPETAAIMRRAREQKPVIGAVGGLCASCAYWIGSNATRLTATPSAQVGAIGVYGERLSLVKRLEREGVEVHLVSAGKHKLEGHPATSMGAAERAAMQSRVDETFDQFVGDIALGRHVSIGAVRGGFGEGRLVTATQARTLGMVDEIESVDNVFARLVVGGLTQQQRHALAQRSLAPLRALEGRIRLAGQRAALAARIR